MAYKTVKAKGTVSGLIEEGYSELEELGRECREASDNFPNSEHPKAQAFGEAADTLEGVSAPDTDCLADHDNELEYGYQVNKDKRKGTSRAVRCSNACGKLTAAADEIRSAVSKLEEEKGDAETTKEELEKNPATVEGKDPEGNPWTEDSLDTFISTLEEMIGSMEELADQLESDAGDCEGVEFPGLYG